MKTWRKALRRLIKAKYDRLARIAPGLFRPLTPQERQAIVRAAWGQAKGKLKSVPRAVAFAGFGVGGERAIYCSAIPGYVLF